MIQEVRASARSELVGTGQMERAKMSMITVSQKAGPATCRGDEFAGVPNPFVGTFVRLAGHELFVESEHDENTLYALATDVVLICDGTTAKAESLTAGRRIRVTTAKCDPNMVIRVEWLHTDRCFKTVRTAAVK